MIKGSWKYKGKIQDRSLMRYGNTEIGGVTVIDDCVVGANAVVCRDILEKHITVVGGATHKISDNGSDEYIRKSKDI